ncbi:Tm-1-like ATP-binding domain-containing protein [Solirubrobacter phytolaccae]|uniref:Tm-1-like ATP-binding domain-containing protein n=1 Tax=Solirubrobacter phytolaccae TaxID=1404360 RepID=A0A9X3SE53_9ACTN|nr:Tm-1-like ATP-binding domain-containing protein [Solirubrobacter phytolaccae]MDA0180062.1 Tm-1-like ATP-binding domain-containing protein [Solirubrobacter phytolaccae]
MSVALVAALDTKAEDADFLASRLQSRGHEVTVVDTGVLGEPGFPADVSRATVARAGGSSLAELVARRDRSAAVAVMTTGATHVLADLHARGRLTGAMAIGGGAGTTIGATALRGLPLGLPKVVLSTLAAETSRFVGTSDLVLFPSIVDVAGVNRISRVSYARAADALAGMVEGSADTREEAYTAPLVAATMFGVTTPCVQRAKARLESAGCEVLVFHACGAGGQMMERLVDDGLVDAVLDVTTTEWADEILGGILTAGPHRLEAAARAGVPQVVSLGATDMANFGPLRTLPARFHGRRLYEHTADSTLLRVSVDEAAAIGAAIGDKLRAAVGPATMVVPRRGVSALDVAGAPFDDPHARAALSEAVRDELSGSGVRFEEHDLHINDDAFADRLAEGLLRQLAR